MKTLVTMVGDTHINSTTGLAPPAFPLDEGGTWRASKFQRKLLSCWDIFHDWVEALKAAEKPDKTVLIMLGDMIDGDVKMRTNSLVTRNESEIVHMAMELLGPLGHQYDDVVMMRGTEAHVGWSGSLEGLVAQMLQTDGVNIITDTDHNSLLHYRYLWTHSGVRFSVRHHTTLGSLPWTIDNAHPKWSNAIAMQAVKDGEPVPDVAVAGHMHYFGTSGHQSQPFFVTLPAWQGPTPYTHRLAAYRGPQVGGVVFTCEDGGYRFDYKIFEHMKKGVYRNG